MRLTLIPPPSYPIPDTLQTHILRPPSLPKGVKTPGPYLRAKRTLGDLGLSLPSPLCADRTLWWSLAVEEVTWDLETEMVEVRFVDGTEERWDLDPEAAFRSSGFVEDSDDEDSKMDLDDEAIERAYRAATASTTTDVKGKGRSPTPPSPAARRSTSSIQSRLHALCVQLRDAYEDLALGSIPITDEHDYLHLLEMAADPSARAPSEWTNQSLFSFHMKGSSDDEWEFSGDSDDEPLMSPRKARGRSPSPELGEEKDDIVVDKDIDITTSPPPKKTVKLKGQLKSRRRPSSLNPVASTSSSTSTLPPPRHDYLSFVSLLATTRRTLLDLFSSSIIPALKDRIDTPTYALWTVSNATRWCRREAILKGGEVAGDLLRLLHDDGETFDMTDDEDEDELDEDETGEEDEWTLRRGFPSSPESAGARRERKLKRNVLYELRDDYELKMWCEKAQARARGVEMDDDNDLAGWSVDRGDDLLSSVGAPRFTHDIQPWEVSKPYPALGFSTPKMKGKKKLDLIALGAELDRSPTKANLPLPPPPSATTTNNISAHTSMMHTLYFSHPSTDASPPLTDCSDDEYFEPGSLHGPAFFCPEDVLSEGFLPPRLPKALVNPHPAVPLGREMGVMREKVHKQLNEIAGLQKKLKELLEYSAKHSEDYEKARTEERRAKSPDIPDPSSLRRLASPSSSPPRRSSSPPVTSIPLARQPLRHRLADTSISAAIDAHLIAQKAADVVASKAGAKQQSSVKRGSKVGKVVNKKSSSPRKRARDNLATIYQATGKTEPAESKEGEAKKEGKSKKRKVATEEEDVIAKMRRRKMSKKQKSKGVGVRVREDVDDLELAQLAAAKQGSSTAAPVLGTFPTNSSSPSTTSSALQFPQKPQGALTSAFVVPPSALASAATFTSPPLTPPSSPPDSIPVPSAPRLTPQALSTHRRNPLSAPQSTSARGDEDEPMVLSGWQDSYRGESDSDEDEPVEDILVDLQEVLEWSAGEEMDSGDGEEGDTGSESDEEDGDDRSGAPQTSPVSDAFDIPADDGAEDESSEEEDEGSTFESPIGLIPPQWSTYTSWEPPRTPTTVQSDLDALRTEVAPRTPSSFPKSFGSAGSFPFVPSALTPPTTTATSTRQAITTAFPTSFEREELQFPLARVATASVIDPTLAALSLGSTTIISSNAISAPTPSASFTATVEHKLWSPIPLRPPTRLTSTPLPANLASLLSHDIPVNSEPLPEPTLLLTPAPEPTSAVSSAGMQLGTAAPSISTSSSRFVAKVTSPFHLPAVVESPFEVEMDSEEESSQGVGKPERKELMEGEEAFVEPAPARAQAGARFIGRMLVGEQQVQGGGGGGGEGSGVDGEDGGSAASAPASP